MEWLTKFFENSSAKQCRLLCCALCVIWTKRNKLMHEGKRTPGRVIADSVTSYIREPDGMHENLPVRGLGIKRWRPSEESNLKVNFDAAFNNQENTSCLVFVIRDSKGGVLSSKSVLYRNVLSAFAAEAIACAQAGPFKFGWICFYFFSFFFFSLF